MKYKYTFSLAMLVTIYALTGCEQVSNSPQGYILPSRATPVQPRNEGTTMTQHVQWRYGGYTFSDKLSFRTTDYQFYKALSRTQPYSVYATEHYQHPYLADMAKKIKEDAAELHYNRSQLAEYTIAFVQQAIPYVPDPDNDGYDYPKYPIETILEGGDCEDKSCLLTALLNIYGFDALLMLFPSHMATGVQCENCDSYYLHNGKKYSFVESTGNCNLGDIPGQYRDDDASIIDVPYPIPSKPEVISTSQPGGTTIATTTTINGVKISIIKY